MYTFVITAWFTLLCTAIPAFADWHPTVLSAIKWTAPDQGEQTIDYTEKTGILRLPIKYYGGVDTDTDGTIDEQNIEVFTEWVQKHIPNGYSGPIGMDYEKPWWKELRQETISESRLSEIMDVYIRGLQVAKRIRPNALWGYYGLPTRRNTSKNWIDQGLSLEPIISESQTLFPSIYDCSRGKDRTKEVQAQISTVLAQAQGKVPVYVFVSPRYCNEDGDRSLFVPDEIFLRQANAAMRAIWIDEEGMQHRIRGLVLWDAYGYTPESEWSQLDKTHKHYFELLQALVEAWQKAMVGKLVIDEPEGYKQAQHGMPEPTNSGETLEQNNSGNRVREHNASQNGIDPRNEGFNNRVPSGRVPSGRE